MRKEGAIIFPDQTSKEDMILEVHHRYNLRITSCVSVPRITAIRAKRDIKGTKFFHVRCPHTPDSGTLSPT
jgi:hypothetical protein